MKVVSLVPRRADGGRRDEVWSWIRDRWTLDHPGIPIIEGHDAGPGKFNRGAAINRAAEQCRDADVLVIADSDSFVDARQLNRAIAKAVDPDLPEFVIAYDVFNYLGRAMSDRIMAGFTGWWGPGIEWSMAGTCSSMIVVTRRLFDEVGGFPAGFEGWGFEDVAFSAACQTFGGGVAREPGDAWHLWHMMSTENNAGSPEFQRNRDLCNDRFGPAAYDRPAMRALLDEVGSA